MNKLARIAQSVALNSLLVASASSAYAAARAVVSEPVVDVGVVAQGEKIEHRFELRNAGDAVLTVREVKPACGCTITKFDKSIAAGETGTITAVLSTRNFSGPIAKSVTVFTSDSLNPKIDLVIKAVIQPQVEVDPGYARFIVVEGPGKETSLQRLRTVDGPDLEILSVRSPFPFIKVTYARVDGNGDGGDKDAKGSSWEVGLALDRNVAPVGPLADFIEVKTNHPKQTVIKIPVSGFIRPEVSVTPRVAEVGSHRLEAPFTTTLEVRNQTETGISLQTVSASIAGVEAEIEEVVKGMHYKVVLTLKPEMAKGPFRGKVQITTTSKRNPVLEVDLSGTVL